MDFDKMFGDYSSDNIFNDFFNGKKIIKCIVCNKKIKVSTTTIKVQRCPHCKKCYTADDIKEMKGE